ncbi:hypothetical protein ACQJBY_023505 [Aegilops geniculata]
MIYPVPGEHDWTRTPGPDIDPPAFKVKRGRKKEKRIKGRFELPKPKDTSRIGTITCGNCGLQGRRYTSCMKQLKPELALRKNKHVPLARNSNAGAAATTPAARTSHPAPTTTPTAGTGGAGRGAGKGAGRGAAAAAAGRGAGRGTGRCAGRGAAPGAGRGAGRGRSAFSVPRQSGPSTSTAPSTSTVGRGAGGRHSGWRSYFHASGN